MSKVEEVARAIFEEDGTGYPALSVPFEEQSWKVRERYSDLARAAIEAMREPTPGMIEAMNRTRMAIQGGYEVDASPWEAAIDAALSEEGE